MKSVFLLQHLHILPNSEEDAKIIGIYSSRKNALDAIHRLKKQPGFIDHPELRNPLTDESDEEDGFYIDEYVLNADHWTEGYVTV